MTTEDKTWIFIGIALAATGGVVYWYKNKKDSTQKAFDAPLYEPDVKPTVATPPFIAGGGVVKPKPIVGTKTTPTKKTLPKATFLYSKDQAIMCNATNGMKVFDVQQKADGTYFSKGLVVTNYENGERIGKIIATQRKPSGAVFYVVWALPVFPSPSFNNVYVYVEHSQIKAIAPILKTINLENVPTLDRNKILKKGIKGSEVSQLQKLLKIEPQDGDFGAKTETALVAAKQVTSISLSSF
jgi:hypothetical protein